MTGEYPGGYAGQLVEVDLTHRSTSIRTQELAEIRDTVGGSALGAKLLLERVGPEVAWDAPENLVALLNGPLSGSRVAGSGLFAAVHKGPMTGSAGCTQANGFLGAYLKLAGYDGILIRGISDSLVYLLISEEGVEIRDASGLAGLDTWQTEDAIKKDLGGRQASVFAIGPAGEQGVRFAGLVGDHGHAAAHNGLGAVLGAKRLKAVAVVRGKRAPVVRDPERLARVSREMAKRAMEGESLHRHRWGTAGSYPNHVKGGSLPVKNYTTNLWPPADRLSGQYLREHFPHRPKPCWACTLQHCQMITVTEGPYAGFEGEEPEYEGMAAFSSVIGNPDAGGAIMLSNLADRLGMDVNETGWVLGWTMECYEKGLLSRSDLDGLEMTWGNVEACADLLRRIAGRQGFGNTLAEGVKRAADAVGGEAKDFAVCTLKGASPRGHDHRARWSELLDTCLSNTGTVECTGGAPQAERFGLKVTDRFSPEEVPMLNAKLNGRRFFEDCACVCRFCLEDFDMLVDCINAITGWSMSVDEALSVGRRAINRLRVFNLAAGLTADAEWPSRRYSSTPADGPAAGAAVAPVFGKMRRDYWTYMGWDPETGRPLAETLRQLGLSDLISP